MRSLATALILVFALSSCGGNVNTTPVTTPSIQPLSLTGPPPSVYAFTSATSLGTVGAQPVLPLFAVADTTNQGTAGVAFWGTKNATTGIISALVEAEVYGLGTPPGEAHVFFNATQLPSLIRDDTSGYSITLSYPNTTSLVVTLCDPSYNAVAQTNWTVGATTGSVTSGSGACLLSLVSAGAPSSGPATVATNLSNLAALGPVLSSAAYVNTLYAALSAIANFQQHKDNPTQIPIGTPIALLFIAAALIFIPTIFSIVSQTTFDVSSTPTINGLLPAFTAAPQ